MPELPEVETVRRQLAPRLRGRRVREAGAHPSAKFNQASSITGARFGDITRRGKFLLMALDDGRELVAHLGMTGQFRFVSGDTPLNVDPYLRAWWSLDDEQRLEYSDVRRFGRIVVTTPGHYEAMPTLAQLGPEPFDPDLTVTRFWNNLRSSRRPIKTRLLSQRPIAGVGNIYADEALWLACINPKATRLSRDRAETLLNAIRFVLQQGIENRGTTLRDYRTVEGDRGGNQYQLKVYGRSGQACFRCDFRLRSAMLDQRTTTWCPQCQAR